MKLICEVPDNYYKALQVFKKEGVALGVEARAILNGIPVPEIQPIYVISHVYDVDGGFGDAIETEKVLGYVVGAKAADEYVEKYSKPEVYYEPYDALYHHTLIGRRIDPLNVNEDPFKDDYAIVEEDDD